MYGKIVANETVLFATIFKGCEFMATIMRKMNIISRCEAMYRTEKSSEHLPGIYHSYIFAICKSPGMTQDSLGKHLCKNKSNVTRHLSFLETNGYIERRVCEKDKREMLVYPTEKMLDILPEVRSITMEWNKKLAEGIPENELEIFHKILDKMLIKSKEIVYGEESKL